MLKPAAATAQTELEMVTLDQLVPRDHLLRLIDTHIRFDFIREKCEGLYCANNGRPAIDPVVLFKMLFIGYLFGVRSERRLVREIEVNVAYRWFLGLRLTDKVPDASTLSQNRRRRFAGTGIEQEIFDTIVEQAIEHKLIGGRVLYTDSTHLKANANKRHFEQVEVEQTPAAYLAELDAAVDAERAAAGQKPLRRTTAAPASPSDAGPDRDGGEPGAPSETAADGAAAETRQIKRSTVDPDAGFMVRDQKPVGFFYLDHRTVDGDLHNTAAVTGTPVDDQGRIIDVVLGEPIAVAPGSACTQTYFIVGMFKSKKETENYAHYIATKFVRFLVLQRKTTQHVTPDRFRFVPMLDMKKRWTDAELFKHFGLTVDEIDYIETTIKPRSVNLSLDSPIPASHLPGGYKYRVSGTDEADESDDDIDDEADE